MDDDVLDYMGDSMMHYKIRPALPNDWSRGAVFEMNDSDPPAPIWHSGVHVPAHRLREVAAMFEAAAQSADAQSKK